MSFIFLPCSIKINLLFSLLLFSTIFRHGTQRQQFPIRLDEGSILVAPKRISFGALLRPLRNESITNSRNNRAVNLVVIWEDDATTIHVVKHF